MLEPTQVRVARSHDNATQGSVLVQSASALQQPTWSVWVQVLAALLNRSVVQELPSSQSPLVLQHPSTVVATHVPVEVSHVFFVQGSLSAQSVSVVQHPVIGA